jgi:phospholipid/cholesterol/gamma-HCH transport system substrate-binding protein
MKVKFNKFERIAGLFVLMTILGGVAILVGVAIKQGWFESKVKFKTTLKNAEGVRVGTIVQMSGIRAGQVVSVELRSNNQVHVIFEISEKYSELVRKDSIVRTLRPFIISDKALDISVGDTAFEKVAANNELPSEATMDIMDLMNGRTIGPQLEAMGKIMDNLRFVAEAIFDPTRSKDIIKIFDQMNPLLQNMNAMSREVGSLLKDANKDRKLVRMTDNLLLTTEEVNKLLPEVNKIVPELARLAPIMAKESPKLAEDLSKIASNMAILTDEMQKTLPAVKATMQEIGPEIPRATRRAMEALDETVITLKALQKSFILKGSAKEVRDEEAERERSRMPSNQKPEAK